MEHKTLLQKTHEGSPITSHLIQSTDCPYKTACPHLGLRNCNELMEENDRLKQENRDLRTVFDLAIKSFEEKEIANLLLDSH